LRISDGVGSVKSGRRPARVGEGVVRTAGKKKKD